MIILGHKEIACDNITCIKSVESIKNTIPNSIVAFNYDVEIIKYCNTHNVKTMVKIDSIKQALFCNNLNVYYILVSNIIAAEIQQLAQNYMFDSKIIQKISMHDNLVNVAKNNIDGVIYDSIVEELYIWEQL